MKMNEQMMMEKARLYMKPAGSIRPRNPLCKEQQCIKLVETGTTYEVEQFEDRQDLEKFCHRMNDGECYEKFTVIAVTKNFKPISVYSIEGTLSEVSAHPRVLVTFCLLTNASGVFLTHNHPGGTCAPSMEDLDTTLLLKRIFEELGITLLDHVITTENGGTYSMARNRDIELSPSFVKASGI